MTRSRANYKTDRFLMEEPMNRSKLVVVFMTVLGITSAGPILLRAAAPSDFTGNISGALGGKSLDHDDWDPNQHQLLYGVQSDFRKTAWPISVAIDYMGSVGEKKRGGAHITGSTHEIAIGVRKVWESFGVVAPFIGAGPAVLVAQTQSSVDFNGGHVITEDSDAALGVWAGGGLLFRIDPRFNLGAGVRYSHAREKLFKTNVDAGGTEFMVLAGLHF